MFFLVRNYLPNNWCFHLCFHSSTLTPPCIQHHHLFYTTPTCFNLFSPILFLLIFLILCMLISGVLCLPYANGFRFFCTIVDDKSRFTWVRLMKSKSGTRGHLVSFVAFIQTIFNIQIKAIRSDNGLEFSMPEVYNAKGIIHQLS